MKSDTIACCLLGLFLLFCSLSKASIWEPPDTRTYYSQDKKFSIEVIPDEFAHEKKIAGVKSRKISPCMGIFRQKKEKEEIILWKKVLVNEVAPCCAIISPYGKFIATFGNWYCASGRGNQVVVIYENGEMIHSLALTDILTEPEMSQHFWGKLDRWDWSQGEDFFDNNETVLHLGTVASRKTLDLKTGKLLDENRNFVKLGKIKVDVIIDTGSLVDRQILQFFDALVPYFSSFIDGYLDYGSKEEAVQRKAVINFHATPAIFEKLCAELAKWNEKYEYRIVKPLE